MKLTPIHYQRLAKVFESAGWHHAGTSGDHMIYKKPGAPRAIVIPKYKTIPVFIIKNNLRTAGISREEYFRLLNS